jgi:hypothetical protein
MNSLGIMNINIEAITGITCAWNAVNSGTNCFVNFNRAE